MEIISAKEAHERTMYTIPDYLEELASLIFKDIQVEISKGHYRITYYKEYVDDWFFIKLNTIITREFFKNLGYNWSFKDDSITISW